ncbi:MAG: DUF1150 family protein [Acetobacteraceae bacterium]
MDINASKTSEQNSPAPGMVVVDIRHISEAQLARLGMMQVAYVRPVTIDGKAGFAIHAADGTPMAVAGDRDTAIAAILQHDMLPTLVQ